VARHKPLGQGQAHEQAAEESRPPGHGHGVHLGQAHARLGKQGRAQRSGPAQMLPGGDLRHHAPEQGVQIGLGGQFFQKRTAVDAKRHGRLVAGSLDTEADHACLAFR